MPVPPVCNKCGQYLRSSSTYECRTCKSDYIEELTGLRERVKRLESLARDAIKWGDGWCPTHRCCATSYEVIQEAFEAALKDQPPASPAEPDPTPLRTCLELLAQLGVEAQRLNRAGNVEALRAMVGRLQQVREGA